MLYTTPNALINCHLGVSFDTITKVSDSIQQSIMELFKILAFLLCFHLCATQRAVFRCINLFSKDSCFAIHSPLKTSLLSNDRNLYELNQAFYPVGVFASTSLINVLYTVNFTASNESSLPLSCTDLNSNQSSPVTFNDSAVFLMGWSGTGVFNIISPLELAKLQLQVLNELFSIFIVPGGGIALSDNFGWNVVDAKRQPVRISRKNTVELSLSLDLSQLSCIPNNALIRRVLQDITIFVS